MSTDDYTPDPYEDLLDVISDYGFQCEDRAYTTRAATPDIDAVRTALVEHDRQTAEKAWDDGVKTALNHAIRNEDGITLRLEHLDGRPWLNPHARKVTDDA
jgi:hypothetical protein